MRSVVDEIAITSLLHRFSTEIISGDLLEDLMSSEGELVQHTLCEKMQKKKPIMDLEGIENPLAHLFFGLFTFSVLASPSPVPPTQ